MDFAWIRLHRSYQAPSNDPHHRYTNSLIIDRMASWPCNEEHAEVPLALFHVKTGAEGVCSRNGLEGRPDYYRKQELINMQMQKDCAIALLPIHPSLSPLFAPPISLSLTD